MKYMLWFIVKKSIIFAIPTKTKKNTEVFIINLITLLHHFSKQNFFHPKRKHGKEKTENVEIKGDCLCVGRFTNYQKS
jgi:hypothetical protein